MKDYLLVNGVSSFIGSMLEAEKEVTLEAVTEVFGSVEEFVRWKENELTNFLIEQTKTFDDAPYKTVKKALQIMKRTVK